MSRPYRPVVDADVVNQAGEEGARAGPVVRVFLRWLWYRGNKIAVEDGGDVVIATLEEEAILEDQQIRKLERALTPIIRTNPNKRLVLNFAKVKFVSSSVLGLLLKVHKRVIEVGGHLQLCNLDGKVRRVFEMTQLVKVFDIVASES